MSPRFAWPTFKDQWDCRIETVLFDGQDAPDVIDADRLIINGHHRDWQDAHISLSAVTTEVTPDGLTDLSAHVMVTCGATQLRLSFPMVSKGVGQFHATFSIPRSAVAAKASMFVEIVSNQGGRHRVVGSGIQWTLLIDGSEAPPRAGAAPLRTAWVDFTGPEAPLEARRNPLAYCYIDVNHNPPALYLNSAVDGFQSLILADNAKLERRRQRDLLGAMIARQVANSLVRAAVMDVTPGEFGCRPSGPTARVLQDMCKALAAELPQTETEDDFYDLVGSLSGDAAASAAFWADVDLALDKITSVSDTVAVICREVKHA